MRSHEKETKVDENARKEVEKYREKISEMVGQIEDERYIKMIYGYVRSAYREEKSRD